MLTVICVHPLCPLHTPYIHTLHLYTHSISLHAPTHPLHPYIHPYTSTHALYTPSTPPTLLHTHSIPPQHPYTHCVILSLMGWVCCEDFWPLSTHIFLTTCSPLSWQLHQSDLMDEEGSITYKMTSKQSDRNRWSIAITKKDIIVFVVLCTVVLSVVGVGTWNYCIETRLKALEIAMAHSSKNGENHRMCVACHCVGYCTCYACVYHTHTHTRMHTYRHTHYTHTHTHTHTHTCTHTQTHTSLSSQTPIVHWTCTQVLLDRMYWVETRTI